MNGVHRLLGVLDFEKFCKIAVEAKKIGGSTPPESITFKYEFLKYFNENDDYQSFGYFKDNNLISVVTIAYRENKARGRFWVISSLFSANKSNIFSFNRPEIGLLIKRAFENSESLCYYEYYYCIAEHVSHVYEKQIDKNIYIPLKRYDRITLDIVPKNTIPTVDLYQKLLGEKKPHNMVIKKRVLKHEFRPSGLNKF